MADDAPVLYEKHGAVAEVVLHRPHRLNAYDVTMRDALFSTLEAVRDDPELRVMILRGAGRAFCSGGDLHEFGTSPSPTAGRRARWLRDVWGTLWDLPVLTLAAVHGAVVGGGFEMMLLCDQAMAARDSRFALPETGSGMIPGVGGTQTLPRLCGTSQALDLVLRGRWLSARDAARLGLVQRVVAPDRLLCAARSRARALARVPPSLALSLKRLVQGAEGRGDVDGVACERRAATLRRAEATCRP